MLIDREVSRAKPRESAYRMSDGRGLYLVVTPSGGRLWRYKYRFLRKEKLMALGQYPEVSLKSARDAHNAARTLLAGGVDPMAERKGIPAVVVAGVTFAGVAALWLEHWQEGKSAQHVDATKRRLLANVYPHIGHFPVGLVEATDLVKMVKTIEARGVGDLAKRALETCGQIFRYGIAHGHCKRNPCADITPADVLKPIVRENLARVSASELPKLLRAIEVYQGNVLTRLAMKLMSLTFVRTSELIGARWDEIVGGEWRIPAERMKMKTPHIVPLSTQARQVLSLIHTCRSYRVIENQHVFSSPYLFPGEGAAGTMSNNTILGALRRMGYGGTMTGHGFRGVASTILHEQGWPHEHIEIQLAHTQRNAVSAAYNHALYLEPRALMMQAWGDYLLRISNT